MKQRQSERARTLLQGRVVFNNRFSLVECSVRDLSKTGAQITFPDHITIPLEVELEIAKRGFSSRARVMWSDGKNHGLMFIGDPQEEGRGASSALAAETAASEKTALRGEGSKISAPGIDEILDEARDRIAKIAGVSREAIRLTLEIKR